MRSNSIIYYLECTQVKCAGMVSKIFFSAKFLKSIQKNLLIPIFKEKGYTMRQQCIGKESFFYWAKLHKKVHKLQKTRFLNRLR